MNTSTFLAIEENLKAAIENASSDADARELQIVLDKVESIYTNEED